MDSGLREGAGTGTEVGTGLELKLGGRGAWVTEGTEAERGVTRVGTGRVGACWAVS